VSDITVCIPLHDPMGIHLRFIEEVLDSIVRQTILPHGVIFSGSQRPVYMTDILDKYQMEVPIKFLKNESMCTSSNLNFLAKQSKTRITKILFQDDFLISDKAIENILTSFDNSNKVWLVAGSKNYDDESKQFVRDIKPRLSKKIIKGINTIGSPSVTAFVTEKFLNFNENLVWMLDCDWYLRMAHSFGTPIVLKKFQVANRLHDAQATHVAQNRHAEEVKITQESHSKCRNLGFNHKIKCICQIDSGRLR
jgi:ribosomal protein S8